MSTRTRVNGKRVTVVGLGRFGGGIGVTRWLCRRGAMVTVSDQAGAADLAESVAALDGLDVIFHLGGHDQKDFLEADLLVVNPAVPKESPLIKAAEAAGVRRTSEINLFLERCPGPVVGITGSVGKSTTTAMLGDILGTTFVAHVGGNLGGSLLNELDQIRREHVVVLELSSFQLEDLPMIARSPHLAVVTNLKPNHLDRYGGKMAPYAAAKKNIFKFQKPDDLLILNAADPVTSAWASEAPGRVEFFDPQAEPFELVVPGAHNQANAQAAWTAAKQLGVKRQVAAEALRKFSGLPHRLQFVAEIGSVRYYNDSKCTTPEGAVVALEAFEPRQAVIIVGGYDKHVSFEPLGVALAAKAKAVVVIGATQSQIVEAVEKHRTAQWPRLIKAGGFAEAVAAAKSQAAAGDVVLLSPACASWDMFKNYQQRGETFVKLVST